MDKLISVIVPVYNVEEYLDRCISSIVNQTYSNIEIILVDDGSPDRCPQICDEWKSKDYRIVVVHKENGGLSDARNCAIRIARGEYYLLVDSDDYIVEDAVEKLANYADGEDIIVAEAIIHEPNRIVHRIHTNLVENYIYSGGEYSIQAIQVGEWFAAACYNMYRTEFIRKNNLYFTVGILHEDIEYTPRLFLAANTVKYLHYEFYRYMVREGSICETMSEKHLNDLMYTYQRWKELNETIQDENIRKAYDGALSKYYISTCKKYKVTDKTYPKGISDSFLIKNSLNATEKAKACLFVYLRPVYVRL